VMHCAPSKTIDVGSDHPIDSRVILFWNPFVLLFCCFSYLKDGVHSFCRIL